MKKKVLFTLAMAGVLCASLAGCHKKAAETTVETDYALEDETDMMTDDTDSDEAEYTDETDDFDDGFTVETDDTNYDDYYDDLSDAAEDMVDAAGNVLSSAQQYVQDSLRKNSNGEEPSVDDEGNLHMDGYRLIQMERETMAFNNEEYIDYSNTDITGESAATETVQETEPTENAEG